MQRGDEIPEKLVVRHTGRFSRGESQLAYSLSRNFFSPAGLSPRLSCYRVTAPDVLERVICRLHPLLDVFQVSGPDNCIATLAVT
jgi:hypothetical protein